MVGEWKVFWGKRKWITVGKYRSSSPQGRRWTETGELLWFLVKRPPFSILLQPLSRCPSASSLAMIRNHNLMLHCHTVSTSILWGGLNYLFDRLRLWLPNIPLSSGRVGTLGSNHLCRLIIEAPIFLWLVNQTGVVDLLLTHSDSAALMPPPLRAWSGSPLKTSLMLPHRLLHRVNMSASIIVLLDSNCLTHGPDGISGVTA